MSKITYESEFVVIQKGKDFSSASEESMIETVVSAVSNMKPLFTPVSLKYDSSLSLSENTELNRQCELTIKLLTLTQIASGTTSCFQLTTLIVLCHERASLNSN